METLNFKTLPAFEKWLKKNHATSSGIWIRFLKKAHKEASGEKSIHYAQALDVALCYGWIDSVPQKLDDASYLHKFSPRGRKSIWSKRNREHVVRLIKEKKMKSAGMVHVTAAKKDGRWEQAYDSPANMKIPEDFLSQVRKDKKILGFYETLNKSNLYAIGWRLQTAKKPETRARRMEVILTMLRYGKKFH